MTRHPLSNTFERDMRRSLKSTARALVIAAVAPLTVSAALTPAATSVTSPRPPASSEPSISTSPAVTPSPHATARRWTPVPSPSPVPAATADPTPADASEEEGDESEEQSDASSAPELPASEAEPTSVPVGPVRAFRTPEREAPPAFVAPQVELPNDDDDAQADPAAIETMPPPDQPYIATVSFRAVASAEIDGFELVIIYPRSAGDFVGSRNGVECRKTGDGTMFADDSDDGTLRILVASNRALTFPLDVVCRFTVEPNAVLTSRLIAVNVAEATFAGTSAEPSALTISVSAR